jgi:hypothetical protein
MKLLGSMIILKELILGRVNFFFCEDLLRN